MWGLQLASVTESGGFVLRLLTGQKAEQGNRKRKWSVVERERRRRRCDRKAMGVLGPLFCCG
jgi:hypothetical protein